MKTQCPESRRLAYALNISSEQILQGSCNLRLSPIWQEILSRHEDHSKSSIEDYCF